MKIGEHEVDFDRAKKDIPFFLVLTAPIVLVSGLFGVIAATSSNPLVFLIPCSVLWLTMIAIMVFWRTNKGTREWEVREFVLMLIVTPSLSLMAGMDVTNGVVLGSIFFIVFTLLSVLKVYGHFIVLRQWPVRSQAL